MYKIVIIFGSRVWFLGSANLTVSFIDPRYHGNEIWDKMGDNSAYVRDICKIFASIGGFRG